MHCIANPTPPSTHPYSLYCTSRMTYFLFGTENGRERERAVEKKHHLGKLWGHWPEDTKVEEGVWRDYYSGEKLDDFEKPWKKPHDKLYGGSKDCLGLYTWWP